MLIKTIALIIIGWFSLSIDGYAQSANFDKKAKCISLGEQYYANYLKEQKNNQFFSFLTMDMSHEVAYSSQLDTCLIYVRIKFKDHPGHQGMDLNKFIYDLLNNKILYSMAYGMNDKKQVIALTIPSSFKTDEEFMKKKEELFK